MDQQTAMCRSLTPRGFRGDRAGWWQCMARGRDNVNPRRCTPELCELHETEDQYQARMAGRWEDEMGVSKVNWGGPASETIEGAPDDITLLAWARNERKNGTSLEELGRRIGMAANSVANKIDPERAAVKARCDQKYAQKRREAATADGEIGGEQPCQPPEAAQPEAMPPVVAPRSSTQAVEAEPVAPVRVPVGFTSEPPSVGRPVSETVAVLAVAYIRDCGLEAEFGRWVLGGCA